MNNGFFAAVKTGDGVRAVYIDEEAMRREQQREEARRRQSRQDKLRRQQLRSEDRYILAAQRMLKAQARLITAGVVLYAGYSFGQVSAGFLLGALALLLAEISFRAGRWFGANRRAKKGSGGCDE